MEMKKMVWKINDIHIPREKWQRVKWLYDYYKGKYSEGLLNRKSKKVLGWKLKTSFKQLVGEMSQSDFKLALKEAYLKKSGF